MLLCLIDIICTRKFDEFNFKKFLIPHDTVSPAAYEF